MFNCALVGPVVFRVSMVAVIAYHHPHQQPVAVHGWTRHLQMLANPFNFGYTNPALTSHFPQIVSLSDLKTSYTTFTDESKTRWCGREPKSFIQLTLIRQVNIYTFLTALLSYVKRNDSGPQQRRLIRSSEWPNFFGNRQKRSYLRSAKAQC